MKRLVLAFTALCALFSASAAEPLRVFIRAGAKSHGPGAHDFPQFLKDWVPLLEARGAKAEGGLEFPTKEQLDRTDVLILHAQEAGNIQIGEQRKNLQEFLKRGGGLVVIHAAAVSRDHDWFKSIIGGSWKFGQTQWLEAPLSLYFTDRENPITQDISNFDLDDEIYYDMEILPEVKVLAAAYTPKAIDTGGKGNKEAQRRAAEAVAKRKGVNIYDIQPQVWTYEKDNYRAFTCIPGHWYKNFSHNGLRTLILRGIAWAGKRDNVDELCRPEELGDALRYVEGGAPRPQDLPKQLEVHPEFEISLVASEPLINNPMNIDWDEKGRLWVVETPEYPNGLRQANVAAWQDSGSLKPGQYNRDPEDRISILEDTDGDGIMDKKTVFADKIELATSSVFHKNGVIVSAAPDIWFFEDSDGDGKADKRSRLYTNLGIRDTHAVINNLRWGPDGWIYATHGYSSSDNVTSGDGSKSFGLIGSGVVRFKPDGSAFEQYCSRGGNTWGLDITLKGEVFYTQPTSGVLFHHVVLPEYLLAKGKLPGVTSSHGMLAKEPTFPAMHWEQQAYVQIDQVGSYTAAAGCAIYEGGAWPAKWQYSYFTTEPTLNIVSHFLVEPDGITYKARRESGREQTEFIRSKNLWFRPIEVRVGPDGALYVVDFCNQAVIHNDTRGPAHGPANAAVRPDRDHYYGRIWKVQHKQAKKIEAVKVEKPPVHEVIQAIVDSPNKHTRFTLSRKALEWFTLDELDTSANTFAEQKERAQNPQEANQLEKPLLVATSLRVTKALQETSAIMGKSSAAQALPSMISQQADSFAQTLDLVKSHQLDKFVLNPEVQMLFISGGNHSTIRRRLLAFYAALNNDWSRSVVVGIASANAVDYAIQCLSSETPDKVAPLLEQLVPAGLSSDLLKACAETPATADVLKIIVLKSFARDSSIPPELSDEHQVSLKKLLAQPALAAATLPLVTRWDKTGVLAAEVEAQLDKLTATLAAANAPMEARVNAGMALASLDSTEATAKVLAALNTDSEPLQAGLVTALEQNGQARELVRSMTRLQPQARSLAFEAVLQRPEATRALLDAVKAGSLPRTAFTPGDIARLRNHPNKPLAQRAANLFKADTSAKESIIAKLTPEVEKPGNADNGKQLFSAACAVCHKFGDLGVAVGPPLDGMGAHGPAELLIHIVDPNREVDPSFWAFNISTHKGEVLQGVITSENSATVTLATQAGVREIAKTDIAKRENTGRSLMPEGLDALGAEALRDILTFMTGETSKQFRIIPLTEVATADSRDGVFAGPAPNQGQVKLARFGDFKIEGVPFFIAAPGKAAGGNLIVLKGGPSPGNHSQTFPARIELPLNVAAKKIHLLSGISGWGWPAVRDETPALLATVVHANGERQTFTFINGRHFSDYVRPIEVPGSKYVGGVTDGQQMRLLTLELTQASPVQTLILESPAGNKTAPVIAAVTADIEGRGPAAPKVDATQPDAAPERPEDAPKTGGRGDGPLLPAKPVHWQEGKTRVLVIGGGSSHKFAEFFGTTDVSTLAAAGFSVHYTEDRDQAAAELANADVAVISVNRKFFDTTAYRRALMAFADAGKGLIMLHPGTWYGYANWPELNAKIIGGGARGHDKIHPFNVLKIKDHPVMSGVPDSFTVEDELYHVNAQLLPPGTAPIVVLAETSPSDKYQQPHPAVWITQHPSARIVGLTLGHDERTHDHPAYQTLLVNAVRWASGR